MKESSLLWLMVAELNQDEYFPKLTEKQKEMVRNMLKNLDPNNAEEELSAKQKKWLTWIYNVVVRGEEKHW